MSVRDGDFEVEFRRSMVPVAPVAAAAVAAEPAERRSHDAVLADVVGIVRFTHPPIAEGMLVEADREVAFVETLGIRNGVRTREGGRVAAVYVSDGQPVEYGQPLFAIER